MVQLSESAEGLTSVESGPRAHGRRLLILTEIISPYRIPVFNALAQCENVDLHVIFLAETDPTQRQWLVYKDEIRFSCEVLPSWRRRIAGRNLLLNRGLKAALQKFSPDVLLCGGYNYLASWESLWWARRRGVPFLVWVESTAMDQRKGRWLIESLKTAFVNRSSGFVVPGKSSAEYVSSFGVPAKGIYVAPNAVDTQYFAGQAHKVRCAEAVNRSALRVPDRFYLYAGRLVREKGVFDLIEAYRRLEPGTRSEIGLVFVGDGPVRSELQTQSRSISPGTVQFAGFAQREELASYYGLAEAFVFPTFTDPWGLVVNEAMACGLPIICSSAAGCAEDLVRDGWNGFVVSPGNATELASAMNRLVADGNLRLSMAQRSWDRIQLNSPEACAAGIAQAALASKVARRA